MTRGVVPVPCSYPLRRWHGTAVALAVVTQMLALGRASPWLHPTGAALLALAVGLVAWPSLRTRGVATSLASRLALLGAFALLTGATVTLAPAASWGGRSHAWTTLAPCLAVGALWVWALHAPVALSRWWVSVEPAHDGALELAESVGMSLTATGIALTWINPGWAWSTAQGTTWTTGACAAAGVAALTWSWSRRVRRGRWLRSVCEEREPNWHMTALPGDALPWSHATSAAALPLVLEARRDEGSYRDSYVRPLAARVEVRGSRASWVRRALHGGTLVWSVLLSAWGAERLLHVRPPSPWHELEERAQALRLADDPCALRERNGEQPVGLRVFRDASARGFDLRGDRAYVFASGRVQRTSAPFEGVARRSNTEERCLRPEFVRRWIEDPRIEEDIADEALRSLREAPEDPGPSGADEGYEGGSLCLFGWREEGPANQAGGVASSQTNALDDRSIDAAGRWRCGRDAPWPAGYVVAQDARALLGALERSVTRRGFTTSAARVGSHAVVRWCNEHEPRAVTFRGDREAWQAIETGLCR